MHGIKQNYMYNTINQLLNVIVQIVTVPYITRVLGADNIGVYSFTYSIATYFVMFTVLGLNNYGNREIAKAREEKGSIDGTFSSIYSMQLLFGTIMIIAYLVFVFIFVKQDRIIFLLQLIYIVSGVVDINWAMYGLEQFKFTAIRNMAVGIVSFLSLLIFVKTKESLIIYTLIMGICALASQLIAWKYINKVTRFRVATMRNILPHIKPNLVLFIPIIAVSLYKIMDKIMLGYIVDMTQVGLYESAEKIIRVPTMLISSLGTVMLPKMTMLYAANNTEKSEEYISKSIDIAIIISSALSFGIMAVAQEFVPLYYGTGFEECINIYIVLLPSCVFLAFSNVLRTQFLIPTGKEKIYIWGVIIGAIVNIIFNLLLIPRLFSTGAAIGSLLAEISVCVVQAYCIRRDLDIKGYTKRCFPFAVFGVIMFGLLFWLRLDVNPYIAILLKAAAGALFFVLATMAVLKKRGELQYYMSITKLFGTRRE